MGGWVGGVGGWEVGRYAYACVRVCMFCLYIYIYIFYFFFLSFVCVCLCNCVTRPKNQTEAHALCWSRFRWMWRDLQGRWATRQHEDCASGVGSG